MSGEHKMVWTEGMFLRPQHFQQQERYLESFTQRRITRRIGKRGLLPTTNAVQAAPADAEYGFPL